MGAADHRLEARLRALSVDDPHGALHERPPVDDGDPEMDLVLDREELEMLKVFHRSFNLPGLRHGLLNPVCKEDYYPPEEGEDPQAVAVQHRVAAGRTSSLLEQAAQLLGDEPGEAIEEEIAGEGHGGFITQGHGGHHHQGGSDLMRWMAQPQQAAHAPPPPQHAPRSGVPQHAPRFSAAPIVRTNSRPRVGSAPRGGGGLHR